VVLLFYLGVGCPHCVEQLSTFAGQAKAYADAGISLVGISTDAKPLAAPTLPADAPPSFAFPLLSDASLEAFKAYRAYDDFEKMPLHGTFLLDGDGLIRWQEIGPDPFTDSAFLLAEAKRLLRLPMAPIEKQTAADAR
jgi:peroxiredoxin